MAFDGLKIYGGGDLNYVMCSTLELTDDNIGTLKDNGLQAPVWGSDTIMLANFTKDTYASSYSPVNEIVGYHIQRYEVDNKKLYEVVTLDNESMGFQDYNLQNHKAYQYRIIPIYNKTDVDGKTAEVFGAPIVTDVVRTDWCGWSVIGTKLTKEQGKYIVDKDNIWTFGLNVEAEPIYPVFNKNYVTGFDQYPKEVRNEENYLEGKLSCLIGNVCRDNYTGDTIETIEQWRVFCNNGELKLLKDPKGHVIPCSIKNTTSSIDYHLLEQPTTISFSFVQLDDARNISIYGLEV